MAKKAVWKHPKFRPTKTWTGSYEKTKKGERFFVLTLNGTLPKGTEAVERVYDSPEQAKRIGWYKA